MSKLMFWSKDSELEISGRQRYCLKFLYESVAFGYVYNETRYMYSGDEKYKKLMRIVNKDNWGEKPLEVIRLKSTQSKHRFEINNEAISSWALLLNTANILGNDIVKLAVKLDAQVELNCWVAEENKKWLSNLIKEGIDLQLFEDEWLNVSEFLDSSNGDVVCLYSVTDGYFFENGKRFYKLNGNKHWSKLNDSDKWVWCLRYIKESPDIVGLEISPETLESQYFEKNLSYIDLFKSLE